MDCLHKVWILTLSGQSMDCLLNPRIEHAQSTDWGNCLLNPRIELAQSKDWGNPWIGVLIKGCYPLWLNRGGLLLEILNSHSTVIVSSSVIHSPVKPPRQGCIVLFMEHLNYEVCLSYPSKLLPGHMGMWEGVLPCYTIGEVCPPCVIFLIPIQQKNLIKIL